MIKKIANKQMLKKIANRGINILLNRRNPGLWHEDFIVNLAKTIKPEVYVELGIHKCDLFNRVIPHANKLIWVDLDPMSGKRMKKNKKTSFEHMRTDEYYEKVKNSWMKIDLLFIDADHSKESVEADFNNFFPMVSDQWIILLHDGYPKSEKYTKPWTYCWDCHKAIEKLSKKNKDYEMVTIPVHPWLTICRKRKKHLSWK